MNKIYEIASVSVNACIKSIGKAQIALIAITLEICFAAHDEIEEIEFTWHYATRLWERLRGVHYPQN